MGHGTAGTWNFGRRFLPVLGILAATLLCGNVRGQWVEDAWARSNSYRGTQTWWATDNFIVYTQRVTATMEAVLTNRFLYHIAPTNFTSADIVDTFTFKIAEVDTNGIPVDRDYTVTVTNGLIQTNLTQNWRAQIKLDCTLATAERVRALGSDSNTAAGVRFYTNDRDQLAYLKAKAIESGSSAVYQQWLAPVYLTNLLTSTGEVLAADARWAFKTTNSGVNIGLAARVDSNFYAYTPPRDLFTTNSFYKQVMTCAFTVATSGTNAVTNTVEDCCGGSQTITGTNAQRIVVVCTNANIANPGGSFADFNYYAFRRVLTNLVVHELTPSVTLTNGRNGSDVVAGTPYDGTHEAISNAFAELSTELFDGDPLFPFQTYAGAYNLYYEPPTDAYDALAVAVSVLHIYTLPEQLYSADVAAYVKGDLPSPFDFYVSNITFNAYGSGLVETNLWYPYFTGTNILATNGPIDVTVTSQIASVTDWPTMPAPSTNLYAAQSGFQILRALFIGWYTNATTGFKYR